jgi:hypothetical protein
VVEDLHHFGEKLDPDQIRIEVKKSDPDPRIRNPAAEYWKGQPSAQLCVESAAT